jgi:protein-arginine kinase activator protein McsA
MNEIFNCKECGDRLKNLRYAEYASSTKSKYYICLKCDKIFKIEIKIENHEEVIINDM